MLYPPCCTDWDLSLSAFAELYKLQSLVQVERTSENALELGYRKFPNNPSVHLLLVPSRAPLVKAASKLCE